MRLSKTMKAYMAYCIEEKMGSGKEVIIVGIVTSPGTGWRGQSMGGQKAYQLRVGHDGTHPNVTITESTNKEWILNIIKKYSWNLTKDYTNEE